MTNEIVQEEVWAPHPEMGAVKFTGLTIRQMDIINFYNKHFVDNKADDYLSAEDEVNNFVKNGVEKKH